MGFNFLFFFGAKLFISKEAVGGLFSWVSPLATEEPETAVPQLSPEKLTAGSLEMNGGAKLTLFHIFSILGKIL